MSIVKVWSEFGRIRKLRLHDISKDVGEAVIDLFLQYFDTEGPSNRAASSHVNTARWSEIFKLYGDYRKYLSEPYFSCGIYCPNDGKVTDVMGILSMSVTRKYDVSGMNNEMDEAKMKEREEICAVCNKLYSTYHYIPMEQNDLSSLDDDRCFFVVPDFRGLVIASELVKKDTARCPETLKLYEDYGKSLADPNFSCVICCSDDDDKVTDIMGISTMSLTRKYNFSEIDKKLYEPTTKEWETFYKICKELYALYNPIEQYNLSSFYDDRGMFVIPEYRGLGIASELVKSRRLICEAQGVPMTGAWAVAASSQIVAARDGWETVVEVPYEELAKRHGIVFTDVPTTVKYMIAKTRSNEDKQNSQMQENKMNKH